MNGKQTTDKGRRKWQRDAQRQVPKPEIRARRSTLNPMANEDRMDSYGLGLVPAYCAITEALADAAREAALGVNGLRLPRRAERRLIGSMAAIAPGNAPVLCGACGARHGHRWPPQPT
jgi:hypothetical protein